MNFLFYNCILEGRQLWLVEPFLLAASEAVRAVCKAGFQNNNEYLYEDAQPPKDGMFLIKVTRKTDGLSIIVFFDTRINPAFVWIENVFDDELDLTMNQFVKMLSASLSAALHKHGWKARLEEFVTKELKNVSLLHSAIEYVNSYMNHEIFMDKAALRPIVISDAITDDVMALLKNYMKGKDTPNAMIAPLRAAKEAGAIKKLTKSIFKGIFGEILGNSISAIDKYMSPAYKGYDDEAFDEMKKQFSILVAKVGVHT